MGIHGDLTSAKIPALKRKTREKGHPAVQGGTIPFMEGLSFDRILAIAGLVLAVAGLGVGLGMDAKTKGEFRFAVTCFVLSAAAFLCTIGYWEITTEDGMSKRALLSGLLAAIVCVLLFEGIRWVQGRHLRTKGQNSETRTASENKQESLRLSGVIEDIGIPAVVTDSNNRPIEPSTAWVLLRCTISNSGLRPTVIRNYSLRVDMVNGETITGVGRAVPSTVNSYMETSPATATHSSPVRTYRTRADALYNKTFPEPLQSGAAVTGFLIYTFAKTPSESLRQKGTTFTVEFEDVESNKYSMSHTLQNLKSDTTLREYPGTQPETPIVPKKSQPRRK